MPGIRAVSAMRPAPMRLQQLAVFDLEGLARANEDSDAGNARKSPGGQDDEMDDLAAEADGEEKQGTQVSLFA